MPLYGLIGYPLSHSFSKKYFTEKFQREGLEDCRYDNFPMSSIDSLPQLLRAHEDLAGLNVTIPYKEKVIAYLDSSSEVVRDTGACNCIRIRHGRLEGHNTDVLGFEQSFAPGLRRQHTRALVLGTGGAAKAVAWVLRRRHISFRFVSRKPGLHQFSYEQVTPDVLAHYPVLINTTPVGMFPAVTEAPPLPYEAITADHYLYDLVYNPAETLFMQKGKEQGATTCNGADMLAIQAEESWKIWNA